MLSRKVRIGVIPAAGTGLRTGHLGRVLPKCLFPIYDKPLIYYIIQNMKAIGVKDIYVILNYRRDTVVSYLKELTPKLKIKINFVVQNHLNGIAGAVMLMREYVNEPFIVILGDDITLTDSLQNIVDIFFKKNAVAVEGVVREKRLDILSRTCCVEVEKDKRILRIKEKPKKPFSHLRGIGVYIFDNLIFDYIKKTPVSHIRGEKEISDTIQLVAKEGRAYAEFINGVNINVNDYDDLLQAWLIMRKYKARGKV